METDCFTEEDRAAKCLVKMDPVTQSTTLLAPDQTEAKSRARLEEKSFTFDKSFCSFDESSPDYAHQEDVYRSFGEEFLDHNFNGYHTCIFAYGQTGSGKSYTMMGTPEQPGLIPRTCEAMFYRIESEANQNTTYNVHVSYFEVYNEHVRDLLMPRTDPPTYLKIRESPADGVYVQGLTDRPVKSYEDIQEVMKTGDFNRTTAATKMNDTSSRSHAVFTIHLKSIQHNTSTTDTIEKSSRFRLVDLAGSERAKATEATGVRLKEGGKINKSLTTLGRVIAALADPRRHGTRPGTPNSRAGTPTGSPRKAAASGKPDMVPYRDSVLTWLLKDSLGGNSKTAMVACISPSDYDETLSTLRYADQAKKIRTRAHTNLTSVSAAQRDAQIAEMAAKIALMQATINSQAAKNRELQAEQRLSSANQRRETIGGEQSEMLADYQKKVADMHRLMEESKAVADAQIRALTRKVEELNGLVPSLRNENENLRRHLGLVVGELRNPIVLPVPTAGKDGVVDVDVLSDVDEEVVESRDLPSVDEMGGDKENMVESRYVEGDSGDETAVEEADYSWAEELQAEAEACLKELGMFKRKIGDDRERFGVHGLRGPLAAIGVN